MRYATRGIVMLESLMATSPGSNCAVLCMDDLTGAALDDRAIPGVRTIRLQDLEHAFPQLSAARLTRTSAEYCWTVTPFLMRFVLEVAGALESVTYLDADLCFYADARPLLPERGSGIALQVVPTAPRMMLLGMQSDSGCSTSSG